MATRECNDCKMTLPLASFSASRRRRDGLQRVCKPCNSLYFKMRVDKTERREWNKQYLRHKRKNDLQYKIKSNLAQRVRGALKGKSKKSASTLALLGCDVDFLTRYLKELLPITAPNATSLEECHIDHIIPCKMYDLTDPIEQQKCFNWRNLQPLTPHDNLTKNARMPSITYLQFMQDLLPNNFFHHRL